MAFQPLWRKYLHDIEAREKPENMLEALKIAFVSGERSKRTSFMEDITNLPPADAIKELTWCAGSNDESTAFHALRHLLYYPTFNDEIDPLMREKLASKNQYHKIPAIIWFVRQGETRDLPAIRRYMHRSLIHRQVFITELEHLPCAATVSIMAEMVEARYYDLWESIDTILKKAAEKEPHILEKYVNSKDSEMQKKVFSALKGKQYSRIREIEPLLGGRDIPLAVHALDALKGKWQPHHLPELKALYYKVKSLSVKIDILAAAASLETGEAQGFLRYCASQPGIIGQYAGFYSVLNNKQKLLLQLRTETNINLVLKGLLQLRDKGSCEYMQILSHQLFNRESYMEKFMDRAYASVERIERIRIQEEKETIRKKKERIEKESPGSSIKSKYSIKIPAKIIKASNYATVRFIGTGTQSPGTRSPRSLRVHRVGNRYAYTWKGGLPDEKDTLVFVMFSKDLKTWTTPVHFKERKRTEDLSLLPLPGGGFLVYYRRCSDTMSLNDPRPYFVIVNPNGSVEKGYYPLGDSVINGEISIFYYKGKYYMTLPLGRGKCGVSGSVRYMESEDLKKWQSSTAPVTLPEGIGAMCPQQIAQGEYFMYGYRTLYHATEISNWRKCHTFKGYRLKGAVKMDSGKYCAILESNTYGFYLTYVSFSGDLKEWSPPLFTGLKAAAAYGGAGEKLLYIYGSRVEYPHLDTLRRDTDGDGLTDVEEELLFTDISSRDTDGDGTGDKEDLNPLRNPDSSNSDSKKIRQAVLNYYLRKGKEFGKGAILPVVSDSDETQSFSGFNEATLSLTPAEYKRYMERFSGNGNIYRLVFKDLRISEDKRSATLKFSYHYAGLAAAGYEIRLLKVNNRWKVIEFKTIWIS
ncbi:MAG: hypothetical protein GY757_20285 [bacterium]|nr:hypothetical protein [bacterium]